MYGLFLKDKLNKKKYLPNSVKLEKMILKKARFFVLFLKIFRKNKKLLSYCYNKRVNPDK